MKKKSNKRKKYTVGGKVNSYIETPSDMLAENQIMMAQAELEAATNPFIQSMQGLSALMGVVGNQFTSMGGTTESSEFTEVVQAKYGGKIPPPPSKRTSERKNKDGTVSTHLYESGESDGKFVVYPTIYQDDKGKYYEAKDSFKEAIKKGELIEFDTDEEAKAYAKGSWKDYYNYDGSKLEKKRYGGGVSVPIEAEGGEVLEMPGGNLLDLIGPSHEQGGIKLDNVPSGSTVYSDEIKIGGKSLADIKKKKARDVEKYSKGSDGIAKNSKERAVKSEQVFDAMSDALSGIFNILEKQEKLANTRKKYNLGGPVEPLEGDALKELQDKINLNNFMAEGIMSKPEFIDYIGHDIQNVARNKEFIPRTKDSLVPPLMARDYLNTSQAHTPGNVNMKMQSAQQIAYEQEMNTLRNTNPDAVSNKSSGVGLTPGDMLGMAGNLYQGVTPYLNTLRSRASDNPNVNAFKGFGEDALKTNEDALGYAQSILDNQLQDSQLGATGARQTARGSARGVNTMRALDIAIEGTKNKADRAIYNDFASTVMANLTQKSQLQNQRDEVVMRGEEAKNLANLQDKDNFFSNIGQDKATIGKTISSLGKFLNQSKERDVMANLMNTMFEHIGFNFGAGQLTGKETESTMSAKHDAKTSKEINEIAKKSWRTATDNPNSKDGKYKSLQEYKQIKGIV